MTNHARTTNSWFVCDSIDFLNFSGVRMVSVRVGGWGGEGGGITRVRFSLLKKQSHRRALKPQNMSYLKPQAVSEGLSTFILREISR